MVQIPQHGSQRELFDIHDFLADIDQFFQAHEWAITVDWFLIETPEGPDQGNFEAMRVSDSEFRSLYTTIYQTIDGEFTIYSSGHQVAHLHAVDSSYWLITSSPEFEQHMANKYGLYQAPNP
jgi:hypothetical protein